MASGRLGGGATGGAQYHEFGRLCAVSQLAYVEQLLGRPEATSDFLQELVNVVTRGRFQGLGARIAQHLSFLAERLGSPADAVRFMVLAERLAEEFDAPMGQVQGELLPLLKRIGPRLDRTQVEEAQADGLQLTLEEAWTRWQEVQQRVRQDHRPRGAT